uniref:MPK1 n=1 Tax=Arundo donax TaxID=35708 RepID=A0A0A9D1H3_ARUDO
MISLIATIFSWSMWRSSLISRSVRLASILLSKALAIFLIATCSPVSELSAEQTMP